MLPKIIFDVLQYVKLFSSPCSLRSCSAPLILIFSTLGFLEFCFLFDWQDKVQDLAGDDYRNSVLDSVKVWIEVFF